MRRATLGALHTRLLVAGLLSLIGTGCGKEGKGLASAPEADGPEASPRPEDAAPDAPIPLIAWVDLLVEDYSKETAFPDTVHDKNIVDDEDVGSYDKFFDAEQD